MFSVIRIQFIPQYTRQIKRIMFRAVRKIAALVYAPITDEGDMQ